MLTGKVKAPSDRQWDSEQQYRIHRIAGLNARSAPDRPLRHVERAQRALSTYLTRRAWASVQLLRLSREVRPDVICLGDIAQYWMSPLLRRTVRVPIVYYIHGEETINPVVTPMVPNYTSYDALRDADAVVVVSHFTRRRVLDIGVPDNRISVIYNGVETTFFTPGEPEPEVMRKYGLAGKRILLTVGRLEPRKGHSTVIRALPKILQAVPDLVYVIAGAGSAAERRQLEADVRQAGVADRVVFTGGIARQEILSLYRACELFAMPNHQMPDGDTEGFGLVFLEAGACGKPVIGGRDGGAPEAVRQGETGLLVDGNNPDEFAAAAISILTQPHYASTLGQAGWRFAQTMTWDATAARYRDLCAQVAGGTRSRAAIA